MTDDEESTPSQEDQIPNFVQKVLDYFSKQAGRKLLEEVIHEVVRKSPQPRKRESTTTEG